MSYDIKNMIKGMFPYIIAFLVIAAIMKLMVYIIPIAALGYIIYKLYNIFKIKTIGFTNRIKSERKKQKTFAYSKEKSYTSFANIFTKRKNSAYKVSGNGTFYTSSSLNNESKVIDVDYEEIK